MEDVEDHARRHAGPLHADLINRDRRRAAKDESMELSDFTVNLFHLTEARLKGQGKLAKPVDWGAGSSTRT